MENNTCLEKQPLCEEMLEKMNADVYKRQAAERLLRCGRRKV